MDFLWRKSEYGESRRFIESSRLTEELKIDSNEDLSRLGLVQGQVLGERATSDPVLFLRQNVRQSDLRSTQKLCKQNETLPLSLAI